MILYKDKNIALLCIEDDIYISYREYAYKGYYLRNSKGYWYWLREKLGDMYRIKHKRREYLLNNLLKGDEDE